MSRAYRQDLNWLVTEFTTRVTDVAHAIVVSADGVPLALSTGIPSEAVEQLAAITSGLTSLMQGAARVFEGGAATQAMVEMDNGLMFVKAISDGSSLAVLTAPECDTRQVSYEMTLLVEAVGELLTPAVRAEVLVRVGGGSRDGPFGIMIFGDDYHGSHCGIRSHEYSCRGVDIRLNSQAEASVVRTNGLRPCGVRRLHGGHPSGEVKSRRRIRC